MFIKMKIFYIKKDKVKAMSAKSIHENMSKLSISKTAKKAECPICCETAKMVFCPYCDKGACRKCTERYLMDRTDDKCMFPECDKAYVGGFVQNSFTSAFVKRLATKRAETFFEREKTFFATTQPLVDREIASRKLKAQLNALEKKKLDLMIQLTEIKRQKQRLQSSLYRGDFINKEKEKVVYKRPCTKGDCRGMVSGAGKCGICDTWFCGLCHDEKKERVDDNHSCDEEKFQSVAFIKNTAKQCPKCHIPIFKTEGCDQMFCTECHTAFSWKTGKVETGRIHNPHFYEWQRKMNNGVAPRVPGDNGGQAQGNCDGLIRRISLQNLLQRDDEYRFETDFFMKVHRLALHMTTITLPELMNPEILTQYEDLRIKYMLGEMDKKKYIFNIKKREKKRLKNNDVRAIVEMFIGVVTDLFNQMIQRDFTVKKKFDGLIEYYNSEIWKIKLLYNNKVPYISLKKLITQLR
jgi:hypothetical protein